MSSEQVTTNTKIIAELNVSSTSTAPTEKENMTSKKHPLGSPKLSSADLVPGTKLKKKSLKVT